MNKEECMFIDALLEEHIIKPESYHFTCGGGAPFFMVDVWSGSPTYTCKYQGDKNWQTPVCETCTGLSQERKTLRDSEEFVNMKLKEFAEAIQAWNRRTK